MRRRSFDLLSAAFTLAIAACKKEPLPDPPPLQPPPPLPEPEPSATTVPSVTTARLAPTETRYGQRCAGSVVGGLHPGRPVDYLELRLDYYPQGSHEVVLAGSKGEACKGAKDAAACTSALASAKAKSGGEYLVYTRGDEVGAVSGRAVGAFLAPIDSPDEAAITLVQSLAEGTSAAAVLPPCNAAAYTKTNAGFETTHTVSSFCDEKTVSTYAIATSGEAKITKSDNTPPRPGCSPPGRGRRPEGLTLAERDERSTLGAHFAESAELEAASVIAFERLEAELRALGAPDTLLRRAKRAASDEVRHATLMEGLARRFGGAMGEVVVRPVPPRSVVDIAVENAVEGCVLETWAALLARWQAEHAGDVELRASMKTLARDETRHAALAWDVAGFLEPLLSPDELARVHAARKQAVADVVATLDEEPAAELRDVAGLPSAARARALYAGYLLRTAAQVDDL